ncbi:MAG: metalloregulator ArsR/SmtB family transcription factor [bacterium]
MMQDPNLSALMRALADPTRRGLYERISEAAEITVVDLTAGSGVSQGAVSQHLKALREAGLVAERPEGRRVFYHATPEGLAPLVTWFDHYGLFWRDRFTDLRRLLQQLDPKEDSDV